MGVGLAVLKLGVVVLEFEAEGLGFKGLGYRV